MISQQRSYGFINSGFPQCSAEPRSHPSSVVNPHRSWKRGCLRAVPPRKRFNSKRGIGSISPLLHFNSLSPSWSECLGRVVFPFQLRNGKAQDHPREGKVPLCRLRRAESLVPPCEAPTLK